MKIERAILIGFIGNYIINTVIAALISLIPSTGATGLLTPQYITFVIVSAIVVAILAWWYGARGLKDGLVFGIIAFVVAIVTAFVTGIAGVLAQTGSFSSVAGILPKFWPFLWNSSTLFLAGYWIIPSALVGWWMGRSMMMTRKPIPPMGSMSSGSVSGTGMSSGM
jgi:hypothetical protein